MPMPLLVQGESEDLIQPFHIEANKRLHFIGIGGIGMSGIAEILLEQGYSVSGSDIKTSPLLVRLQQMGARIYLGQDASHIQGTDVVVVSSAISSHNPELMEAKKRGLTILARAEMLAFLMQLKTSIAISGTHGKTSTTSLLTSIFAEAGLDPTYAIGGVLKAVEQNSAMGKGDYFIAEADESDGSFLFLNPEVGIVTNINADHLVSYGNSFDRLKASFYDFIHQIKQLAVICSDDESLAFMEDTIKIPWVSYGFSNRAMVQLTDYVAQGIQSQFVIRDQRAGQNIPITLNLPGRQYASNATATYIVARHFGIEVPVIQRALAQFKGVGRRFQVYGSYTLADGKTVLHVDDYGHHPREIEVTLQSAREAFPGRRLVLIHQPHRYSRVAQLFPEFVQALAEPDCCILLDIYPAGEQETLGMGINGWGLYKAVSQKRAIKPTYFAPVMEDLSDLLHQVLKDQDVLITQGAGSIGGFAEKLIDLLHP